MTRSFRINSRAKKGLTLAGAVVVMLAASVGALAHVTSTGTGTGSAAAGTLNAPTNVTVPSTSSGLVHVTWTASVVGGGAVAPGGYYVERNGGGASWVAACGTGPGSTVAGTSCDDTITFDGDYTYRVIAVYHSWTATSAASNSVHVVTETTPPYVVAIDRTDPPTTNLGSVQWAVTFSESVSGVDASDFTVVPTGLTGTSITNVGGSGTSWTVTASTGSGDGTLGLDLVDDDTIEDGAGNPLGTFGGPGDGGFAGEVYTIDKTAPSVLSIDRAGSSPTNASSVDWTVTFDEPVAGVDATDFALASGGGLSGASIASVTPVNGGIYTVTADTGTGGGALRLDLVDDDSIADVAGHPLGGPGAGNEDFAGQTYTLDRIAPTVSSIDRADASPTNAGTVHWTVSFSEPVTSVGSTDFALVQAGGVSGAAITGASGSGSGPYTVTATTGSGDGTLGLNLVDDDTIEDGVGNPLGGTGAANGNFTGDVYSIEKTPPSVTVEQKVGQVDPTNVLPMLWAVTFSEPVVGFDGSDLTRGGGSTGGTVVVSGSGASYVVSLSGSVSNGTTSFSVAAGRASDAAGNLNSASTSSDNSVTYDSVAPSVTVEQKVGQVDPTNVLPMLWAVTFSEPVVGFDGSDLTRGGGSTGGTVVVSGSGASYVVSLSGSVSNGTTSFSVAAGRASDAAGNLNSASTSSDNTVTYDTVAPVPTIGASTPAAYVTSTTPTIAGTAGTQAADATHGADNTSVTVKIYAGLGTGGTLLQTLTPSVSAGNWSVSESALGANAQYTLQVVQGDGAGNSWQRDLDFRYRHGRSGRRNHEPDQRGHRGVHHVDDLGHRRQSSGRCLAQRRLDHRDGLHLHRLAGLVQRR